MSTRRTTRLSKTLQQNATVPMTDAIFTGVHDGLPKVPLDDKEVVGMFSVNSAGKVVVKPPGGKPARKVKFNDYAKELSRGSYGVVTLHKLKNPPVEVVKKTMLDTSDDEQLEQASEEIKSMNSLENDQGDVVSFFNRATGHGFMSTDGVAAYLLLSSRSILMARASHSLLVFTDKYPEEEGSFDNMKECMFLYEHQIAQLTVTLMSVLEYLRSFGVYYYDIKPDNVLVYTDGSHLKFRFGDHGSVVPFKYSGDTLLYVSTFPIAAYAEGHIEASVCNPIASNIYTYMIAVSVVMPLMMKLLYVQRQRPRSTPSKTNSLNEVMPFHIGAFGFDTDNPDEITQGFDHLVNSVYSRWPTIKNTIVDATEEFPYASNARDFIAYVLESVVDYFLDVEDQTRTAGTTPAARPPIVASSVPSYQELQNTHIQYLRVNQQLVTANLGTSFTDYDPSLLRVPKNVPKWRASELSVPTIPKPPRRNR